jgi:hypothetical protein
MLLQRRLKYLKAIANQNVYRVTFRRFSYFFPLVLCSAERCGFITLSNLNFLSESNYANQ